MTYTGLDSNLNTAAQIRELQAEIERLRVALEDALIWLDPEAKNESLYEHRDLMLTAIRAALGHQQSTGEK